MSRRYDSLSLHGLKGLHEGEIIKLSRKKFERDDIGKSWTESKIRSWQIWHDKEIREIEEEIANIELQIKERTCSET